MARQMLSQVRRRRKVATFRRGGIAALLASVAAASFLFSAAQLASIPEFFITGVTVSGNVVVSLEEIQKTTNEILSGNYFLLFPRRNAYLYPRQGVTAALLAAYPRIKTAEVRREGTSIIVAIVERTPAYLWCGNVRCSFLDEDGIIFAEGPTDGGTLYVKLIDEGAHSYSLGDKPLDDAAFARIKTLLAGIGALGFAPRSYQYGGEYEILMAKETELRIPADIPAEHLLENLTAALPQIPKNLNLA